MPLQHGWEACCAVSLSLGLIRIQVSVFILQQQDSIKQGRVALDSTTTMAFPPALPDFFIMSSNCVEGRCLSLGAFELVLKQDTVCWGWWWWWGDISFLNG